MKAVHFLLAVLAIVCTVVIAQEKEFRIGSEEEAVSRPLCVLQQCVARNIEISQCC
jgi:hypothetical protein